MPGGRPQLKFKRTEGSVDVSMEKKVVRFIDVGNVIDDLNRKVPLSNTSIICYEGKREDEVDLPKRRKMANMLSVLCSLVYGALHNTLSGNGVEYQALPLFRYELGSLCLNEDSSDVTPDQRATTSRNLRMQTQAIEAAEQIKILDPLLGILFATRETTAPRSNNVRLKSYAAKEEREYGFGLGEEMFAVLMTYMIKFGITYKVVHMGGQVTNVGVEFTRTNNVNIRQLARECVLKLDSALGKDSLFKCVPHKFRYITDDPDMNLDEDGMQRVFSIKLERGGTSYFHQWDWSLRAAHSEFEQMDLDDLDMESGLFNREALWQLDSDRERFGVFKSIEQELLACGDIRRKFANKRPHIKAMHYLNIAERYRQVAEFIWESRPLLSKEWCGDNPLRLKLVRHLRLLESHAWYYAGGCATIAGDYHTAVSNYRRGDRIMRREYGNFSTQYLFYLLERTYMASLSYCYMIETRHLLENIDRCINRPNRSWRGETEHEKSDREKQRRLVMPQLTAIIESYNAALPRYHELVLSDCAAYGEWEDEWRQWDVDRAKTYNPELRTLGLRTMGSRNRDQQ